VIGSSQRDLRFLAHSPTWWLRASLALLAVVALALGIVTRATSGSQAVDRLIGRSAPAFSLPVESRGQAQPGQISLASRRGHPVLLVFFYTLCTHCLGELETVRGVAEANAGNGLTPLYIDSPAEPPTIPDAYLTRAGVDAPALLDGNTRVATAYGIRYYPAIVLLDAGGTVRATWTGEASAADLYDGIRRLTSA
jgi:thiol-disulfide isomerase/thioredoxin